MSKKILIIRMSALGDIIHGLPVAAAIKKSMPEADIGWLVEAGGAPLLRENPAIDRLHVLRRAKHGAGASGNTFLPLISEIRREGYDVAIDLQGLTKSAVWTRLSGARERIGFSGQNAQELSRFFYNRSVEPPQETKHIIHQNLELLGRLGISDPAVEFPLTLDPIADATGEKLWGEESTASPRIVLNIGGGWPTKLWPAENFGRLAARLAEEFKARVAVAWGPGEEEEAEETLNTALEILGSRSESPSPSPSNEIPGEPGVYPLPKTTFLELGGCLRRSALYVGGDTGPTHLAAALGVSCVALFGPSDAQRNGPMSSSGAAGQSLSVIQLSEPSCIPCWKTKCSWHEPLACLKGISVDRVFEACAEIL